MLFEEVRDASVIYHLEKKIRRLYLLCSVFLLWHNSVAYYLTDRSVALKTKRAVFSAIF